jgi:hypothetical protein
MLAVHRTDMPSWDEPPIFQRQFSERSAENVRVLTVPAGIPKTAAASATDRPR